MFAPRIWGFDGGDQDTRAALAAGWRRRDLIWERLQERGNAAWSAGEKRAGARDFHRALLVSWLFSRGDPRRATSLANAALADREAGRQGRARRRLEGARSLWRGVPGYVETLQVRPRARSSLFHLRMEAKHWDTYQANTRVRLGKFAAEAEACLDAIAVDAPIPHRLYSRWRGERPSVFDDSRKLLAAALLICAEDRD